MGVILTESRPTKTIKDLPEYEGSEVVVYGRLTVGDVYDAGADNIKMVALAIKSWNFTDEKGNPLEVSVEALRGMKFPAFTKLLDEVTEFATAEKKSAKSSTSGQQTSQSS